MLVWEGVETCTGLAHVRRRGRLWQIAKLLHQGGRLAVGSLGGTYGWVVGQSHIKRK